MEWEKNHTQREGARRRDSGAEQRRARSDRLKEKKGDETDRHRERASEISVGKIPTFGAGVKSTGGGALSLSLSLSFSLSLSLSLSSSLSLSFPSFSLSLSPFPSPSLFFSLFLSLFLVRATSYSRRRSFDAHQVAPFNTTTRRHAQR